jgi:hypothetical protein
MPAALVTWPPKPPCIWAAGTRRTLLYSPRCQSLGAACRFGFTEFVINLPFIVGTVVSLIYFRPRIAKAASHELDLLPFTYGSNSVD